jgi:PAS domain S-box-containing protein
METNNILRILCIEDLSTDYELAVRELKKIWTDLISCRVETREEFLAEINHFNPDIIISDYSLPSFNGIEALKLSLEYSPKVPFIVLTGSLNEETAVTCMKMGATDYVIKGHITRLPYAVRDALEQVKFKNEKQKVEEDLIKISRAVEQGPASVLITNQDGIIEFVNQKFCEITGWSKEEVIGKNPRILKSNNHDKSFYEELWNTLRAGNNWSGEILNKRKNGELFWEHLLISPLVNSFGDISNFVAVKEDITEKKRMYLELVKAKESAESANKLKDAFIANISHEIRTPLNGILGMASLIKEIFPGEIKKEDEELFEGIDYSSQRLIRTVDLILNYSRLQVGEYPLFIKKIDLASICQNLIREFTIEANHKLIELSFQNECGYTIINADENSIVMAISNLLGNAIKFSNTGSVKLILCKDNSEDIFVDVIDHGIGISEEYLDKIFEPYLQEQIGYGRSYDGVGLGLALVKKVLNLNGASVTVKSKKGKGSTFSINFGKALNSVDEKIKSPEIPLVTSTQQKSLRALILIVEDDAINQRTITRFIENNYNSIVTNSSEIALDILQNKKIDLILMDISISGDKNGLEFTKDLKSSKQYSHIPIIAITAHAFEIDKQNALEYGCDNYLAKPFTQQELLEIIGIYLHSS